MGTSRSSRTDSANPPIATPSASRTHSTSPAEGLGARRSSMPRSDWFDVPALGPSRPGESSASVQ